MITISETLISCVVSSTGRRPAELLGWFVVRRPPVRPLFVSPITHKRGIGIASYLSGELLK